MMIGFYYNNEGAGFMFGGDGVGNAVLKTFEVLVDGKPQSDWLEMCRALGIAGTLGAEFTVPQPEIVFEPHSLKKTFWIPPGPNAEELKLKVDRIVVRACYCSIYPECWQIDFREIGPKRVSSCPKTEMPFTAPPTQVRVF
ncbi:MAG: hypothetical protein ABSF45_31130 [Terriglobia bacterium]|jgi:hypothetical protein